jgi:hypothetical protein
MSEPYRHKANYDKFTVGRPLGLVMAGEIYHESVPDI